MRVPLVCTLPCLLTEGVRMEVSMTFNLNENFSFDNTFDNTSLTAAAAQRP